MSPTIHAIAYIDEIIGAVEVQRGLGFDSYFDIDTGCACAIGSLALKRAGSTPALDFAWEEFTNPETTKERRFVLLDVIFKHTETSEAQGSDIRDEFRDLPWVPTINDGGPAYDYHAPDVRRGSLQERQSEDPVARKERVLKQLRDLRSDLFASLQHPLDA